MKDFNAALELKNIRIRWTEEMLKKTWIWEDETHNDHLIQELSKSKIGSLMREVSEESMFRKSQIYGDYM